MHRAVLVLLLLGMTSSTVQAQTNGWGNSNFGARTRSLGNAGGFATGVGMSNSTMTSANFGASVMQPFSNSGGFSNGANAGLNYRSGVVGGYIAPSSSFGGNVYNDANMMNSSDIDPFNTATTFGYDTDLGLDASALTPGVFGTNPGMGLGWNNWGNASPFLGSSFMSGNMMVPGMAGGYGWNGAGLVYPNMAYPTLGWNGAALGMTGNMSGFIPGITAGMPIVPGIGMNGMVSGVGVPGLAMPGMMTTANGLGVPYLMPGMTNGLETSGASRTRPQNRTGSSSNVNPLPARTKKTIEGQAAVDSSAPSRLQNKLASIKSPASLKNVRVRMSGRTAILHGTVDSVQDERLVARLALLEPGIDEVVSDLQYPGKRTNRQ